VEKLATRIPVYDIAVEGEPEFFANGVLVHNCDEMAAWRYVEAWDQAQFGLRLGRHPQAVITTTPRPTKELRELYKDPATFVTLGTTYDNRANLAPAFFDKIIRRYEGTRMGRQELHAEILEDNPNALWKRADIDSARILPVDLPELQRIVIGLDPSVSDSAEHDLAGIVAVGRGAGQWRDHGYVLADKSILATPLGWARQTIALYGDLKADRVIGEINNGGAMIEVTLRVVDPNVSYKQVTASRGKLTRAEPCASMYEQHRMHHVGMFPGLEDELCDYDQLSDKPSPNRMDALVWAHYELFGEQIAGQGLFDLLQHQYDEHQKKLAEDKLFEDM
jgi:phage terminase large subunit-like protein